MIWTHVLLQRSYEQSLIMGQREGVGRGFFWVCVTRPWELIEDIIWRNVIFCFSALWMTSSSAITSSSSSTGSSSTSLMLVRYLTNLFHVIIIKFWWIFTNKILPHRCMGGDLFSLFGAQQHQQAWGHGQNQGKKFVVQLFVKNMMSLQIWYVPAL